MLGAQRGRCLYAGIPDYTVIDLETTGLSPGSCEIIECAAVKVRGGDLLVTYSDDGVTLTGDAVRVFEGAFLY